MGAMASPELEAIEVDLLLEGVQRHFGFDLRGYCRPTLLRRLRQLVRAERLRDVSSLQSQVLHDEAAMERALRALSRTQTVLFEDPEFWLLFRRKVVPLLRTHPTARLWVASCGAGEGAWTLAMMLDEEGLLPRCRIYATDASEAELRIAQAGAVPLDDGAEGRYARAGGAAGLGRHLLFEGGCATVREPLRGHVFFAQHNLATDAAFNEFNVVLCRNVLLAFNRSLHNRVHARLYESLGRFGILGLGRKESLLRTPHAGDYEELESGGRLYRRLT
jgi:chemotaxis protein methyltransferase CheR